MVPSRTPAQGLRAIAEAEAAHLVVVGTGSRTRAANGAVARGLLRDGRWSVAVVSAAQERKSLNHVGVIGDGAAGDAARLAARLIASDAGCSLRSAPARSGEALHLLVVGRHRRPAPRRVASARRRRPATVRGRSCPVIHVPPRAHLPVDAAIPT
jgi:hypothetical protein